MRREGCQGLLLIGFEIKKPAMKAGFLLNANFALA